MGEEVGPCLRKRPPPKKPALKSPQKLERPRGEEKKIWEKKEEVNEQMRHSN